MKPIGRARVRVYDAQGRIEQEKIANNFLFYEGINSWMDVLAGNASPQDWYFALLDSDTMELARSNSYVDLPSVNEITAYESTTRLQWLPGLDQSLSEETQRGYNVSSESGIGTPAFDMSTGAFTIRSIAVVNGATKGNFTSGVAHSWISTFGDEVGIVVGSGKGFTIEYGFYLNVVVS